MFPFLDHKTLWDKIKSFDALKYEGSRNYLDGGVSQRSPYITHGIITTKELVSYFINKHEPKKIEKWLMELTRKEFFQHIIYHHPEYTHHNVRDDKTTIQRNTNLPADIAIGQTSTKRVNDVITKLKEKGYLHNHERMRLASRVTHVARIDRKQAAQWSYYYFLDGDLGPNHLSRQRVQSTFGGKPYFFNEDNLKKYSHWRYHDEFLRGTYDDIFTKIFGKDPKRDESTNKALTPLGEEYGEGESRTPKLDTSLLEEYKQIPQLINHDIHIISPRELHPSRCHSGQTVCLFDSDYLTQYPRSPQRLSFVLEYIKHYAIDVYFGDSSLLLQHYLADNKNIHLTEQIRPIYKNKREIFKKNNTNNKGNNITRTSYDRVSSHSGSVCYPKFFKRYKKAERDIRQLQSDRLF